MGKPIHGAKNLYAAKIAKENAKVAKQKAQAQAALNQAQKEYKAAEANFTYDGDFDGAKVKTSGGNGGGGGGGSVAFGKPILMVQPTIMTSNNVSEAVSEGFEQAETLAKDKKIKMLKSIIRKLEKRAKKAEGLLDVYKRRYGNLPEVDAGPRDSRFKRIADGV